MQRIILHIDFDSFFASVEQQDDPTLRGKPIGVTAQNGRNCIIAASIEAKKRGIRSPSRTYDAKRVCPDIQFVPAHFVRYWEVSQKFIAICKDYSPTVEIFSIDEVFIDVSLTAPLFGGVDQLITRLKKRIRDEIGVAITASVGISHNKLLAKLASGLHKPNGVFPIREEEVIRVYNHIKLTDFCGIGRGIEKRLQQMGIVTPIQLRLAPLPALIAEFGEVEGHVLKNIGMGVDTSPVVPDSESPEVKSVGRQYCLPQNEYNRHTVLQNIFELCEEIAIKLRRIKKKARSVGIYLRGDSSISGRQTWTQGIDTGKDIFESLMSALAKEGYISDKTYSSSMPKYVRQMSIWTGNLQDAASVPESLFPHDRKQQKLAEVVDQINAKYGHHTIRNGFLLYADQLTSKPNGFAASIRI
jgi:DNA polymerase IV